MSVVRCAGIGHRAWSMGQERNDTGTRRNGETEIRGRRSEVRSQKTDNLTLAPCALRLEPSAP